MWPDNSSKKDQLIRCPTEKLHKTALDLLTVRRQPIWRVMYCKVIAGQHVTTQHKPRVFVVRMQERREVNGSGETQLNGGHVTWTQPVPGETEWR